MKDLLQWLLAWWSDPSTPRPPFAEDFKVVGVSSLVDSDTWLFLVAQKLPWEDLLILGVLSDGNSGAIVIEGTDPVTLLRQRVVWLVEAHDGKLTKLVEISSVVEPPPKALVLDSRIPSG